MKIVSSTLLFLILVVPPLTAAGLPDDAMADAEVEFFDPFAEPAVADLPDPLEPLNRAAFWLNDKVYTHLLKPVCLSIPAAAREEIGAWLKDLGAPLRLGSAELDFEFRDAGSEVGRFVLHGLLRILDRFDSAREATLAAGEDDFGSLLETLGIGPGFYLVLPVFGPSTLREGIGWIASIYLDPVLSLRDHCPVEKWSLLADLQMYESIRRTTLDPYLSIRDAYAQQQASADRSGLVSHARTDNEWELSATEPHLYPRPL